MFSPDNTYSVSVDNGEPKTGSLLTDFQPPVNPPNEIDDPEDKKPADWVDIQRIADPAATKVFIDHGVEHSLLSDFSHSLTTGMRMLLTKLSMRMPSSPRAGLMTSL